MGALCCGSTEKKDNEKGEEPDKGGQKTVFNNLNEDEKSEKKLIPDEKLTEALKNSDSAYGKTKNCLRKRSLANSQYNKHGLVDSQSKELEFVKNFMAAKNYDVKQSIGSGSYAQVYKAVNNKKNKVVAIKVIDLTKANDNYRNNFLPREIKVLRKLKHSAIIKIYQISQINNRVFMVMEFAAEGTFADWLKNRGAMKEDVARAMFKQVFHALNEMHRQKIAHRDLKLENILVTSKLNTKVSDFSYATFCTTDTEMESTTFCGSLPYLSPEILERKPHNPIISDVWSIGVCLFIMLNHNLPFKIDDNTMRERQRNKDCKFRTKVEAAISPQLKALLTRMLEPDVNTRITAKSIIKDQWLITDHSKD